MTQRLESEPRLLRAATRGSPLALWQARHVSALLVSAHPGLRVDLVVVDTEGDRRLDVPISSFGGKGVFAKEVQAAVLDGRADFAVHSAKDLPAVTIAGLTLACIPERGDARDALVGLPLDALGPGATVATGSQRRRAQLAAMRPDLVFVELRGNMATRLSRVPEAGSIVVAAVALERLGLAEHIVGRFAVEEMIPQVGQAALAVECRAEDHDSQVLLAAIEHPNSRRRVDAERAFLAELGGDCDLPAGAYATLDAGEDAGVVRLNAFLASSGEAGAKLVRYTASGDEAVDLGVTVAHHLRSALGPG